MSYMPKAPSEGARRVRKDTKLRQVYLTLDPNATRKSGMFEAVNVWLPNGEMIHIATTNKRTILSIGNSIIGTVEHKAYGTVPKREDIPVCEID